MSSIMRSRRVVIESSVVCVSQMKSRSGSIHRLALSRRLDGVLPSGVRRKPCRDTIQWTGNSFVFGKKERLDLNDDLGSRRHSRRISAVNFPTRPHMMQMTRLERLLHMGFDGSCSPSAGDDSASASANGTEMLPPPHSTV